jgi:hypothetical protein
MRFLLVMLALLGGCATPGICDYDLAAEGWYSIDSPPGDLKGIHRNADWHWFTNDGGDFLACYALRKRGVCGNVYTLYRRDKSQGFKEEEIVCTR